ncbi:uncharacterized protein LOC124158467 [Ischnura elegans]|uniref:uncharacterized protein LOC124158467 n=1 Tax=Ischnura elegans TaxID=197161 RepID=UPI001ED88C2C|nr:uncharacterized protein LOC124158467 [Ischnura elegans]XP_046389537.1 uncharacterized protein LOC124158467 [Ischnura elegans]
MRCCHGLEMSARRRRGSPLSGAHRRMRARRRLGEGGDQGPKAKRRGGWQRVPEGEAVQQKAPRPRFRDPLPMKMRALPQSFWQQPNLAPTSAPGGSVCALPPLPLPILLEKHCQEPAAKGGVAESVSREREEVVSAANTDLLFSLFRGVERAEGQARFGTDDQGPREAPKRPPPPRRGRPRKAPSKWSVGAGGASGGGGVRDDDPCLVSAVAHDAIRPLLPSAKESAASHAPQVLAMVTLPEADGNVSLPTLDVQHNYSQILSKLVMKL